AISQRGTSKVHRWLILVLLLPSAPALAKERTAGCAGFPRAYLRVENSIRLGAPIWNQGNQLATYAVYRDTTRAMLDELIKDDACGPLFETLRGALERARKARTPGTAGWHLRHGFDAFLELVARGDSPKLPLPREVERAVAPYYDRDCPDLFQWVLR